MNIFDIEYESTTEGKKYNIYGKKAAITKNIPPLKVGHNWSLLEKETPIPFRGTFEALYLSDMCQQDITPLVRNPLISRIYPQGGNFTFVPGEKSLEEWIEEKTDLGKVIKKFKICTCEREQMKDILTKGARSFGTPPITTYEDLFPEQEVTEIDSELDEFKDNLNYYFNQ
ncbi:hypothetical protein TEHN7126_1575 [Tetragenococcus halophilus subsp. halophilus]|uniref:hypothetical protein n=1 Tax=Tetragenococcus halophilus TaxID=51669 RepID=UPI000CB97414|nr:hypothetical protein [Tetragenococcus halophilus]GBD73073.1 hypothetical protein TEHN7125_1233 [Tetragenococcus halophilus subsp. halophilus]GBD75876.1 hypothetical protein TEHN7126_1575 [Tetragenococcus halophilus subsp. halophilus]